MSDRDRRLDQQAVDFLLSVVETPDALVTSSTLDDYFGATLVRTADDVFEALTGPRTFGLAEPGREFLFDPDSFRGDSFGNDPFGEDYGEDDFDALDDFGSDDRTGAALADQILRLLGPHPVEIDEIARQCGASPAEFSLAVLKLDLAGRIDLLPGGMISSVDPAT